MFTLAIETDNSAFTTDPEWSEDSTYAARAEVARILDIVGSTLENGGIRGICRDINGNQVGSWRLDSSEEVAG